LSLIPLTSTVDGKGVAFSPMQIVVASLFETVF